MWSLATRVAARRPPVFATSRAARFLSSKGGGDGDKKDDTLNNKEPPKPDDDDPFGLQFQGDQVGPLPPKYKRDDLTGRMSMEIEKEITQAERDILQADDIQSEKQLFDDIDAHWAEEGIDESGMPAELDKLGQRIRDLDMQSNVLGRSTKAQSAAEQLDDGSELGRDKHGFSQHLTKREYRSFAEFMKKKHNLEVEQNEIPVQENESPRTKDLDEAQVENDELATKWLTARARRQMEGEDENPYSDLMPGDLSPTRLVNRKRAKKIPTKLLSFNNLSLLRMFISDTGQIKNRVQTRLGARDQRKIKKLIKRARHMGLIPFVGQFKVEEKGWLNEKDIHRDRWWEKELKERGLVLKKRDATPLDLDFPREIPLENKGDDFEASKPTGC